MKSSKVFKETIKDHLEKRAAEDELFAVTFKKENKNIDDCVTYILNTVQKSGCNGFTDNEIFGMAVHYYDEDVIEVGKPINGNVVVNHKVKLTDEDKAEAKEKAMQILIEESKVEAKKELSETIELTPEDIAEAKKMAIDEVVKSEKEKMTTKRKTVKKEVEPTEQVDLFA